MIKVQARARVQLLIEMDAQATWGERCAFEQVHQQAREEVINRLRSGKITPFVVLDARVIATLVERNDRGDVVEGPLGATGIEVKG